MHGDGIKLAITTNNPPARLLDVTRLIRRAGRIPTGIDRVEQAYLTRFLDAPTPLFGLVRTSLGYVLLDHAGLREISKRINGVVAWGPEDRLSWASRRLSPAVRQAQSDVRRFALARCLPSRLGKMLRQNVPADVQYFNIGHSNLTDRVLWSMRHDLGAQICVFVHDAIPLDYPQFQRPGTVEAFRAKLKRVRAYADLLIFNSAYTRDRATAHMSEWGDVPRGIVAPLGVDLPKPDQTALPADLDTNSDYFVVLGTIEPRKNHALVLDVWDDLIADHGADEVPNLYICGTRGWRNEAVFQRLDALDPNSPIQELPGLTDGAIAALLDGAKALIFPSAAEGYGLPAIEAASLGTPVICTDLPVFREILGDIPVYLKETDRYLLRNLVESLLQRPEIEQLHPVPAPFIPPTWEDHFKSILVHV